MIYWARKSSRRGLWGRQNCNFIQTSSRRALLGKQNCM